MKNIFGLLLACISITATAQCSIQTVVVDTACYCDGSALAFNPVGTPPFQYQWNFGDTTALTSNALCAGLNYVVTMTDSTGCTATDTVLALGSVMALSHNVANTSCPSCCDGIDTVHAALLVPACGPVMYQWFPAQQFASPDSIATGLCQGTYTVMVTNQCGCASSYIVFIASGNPNATDFENTAPTCEILIRNDQIILHANQNIDFAEFYDLTGRLVSTVNIASDNAVIERPYSSSPLILNVRAGDSQWSNYIPPRK